MKRLTFIVLAGAAATALPPSGGNVLHAQRVRSVVRLARADRSVLVGSAGGCASRRRSNPLGGYVAGDFS